MVDSAMLVDTSVIARAHQPSVGDRLEFLLRRRLMWTCRVIDLELVYSSRAGDVGDMIDERASLPDVPITPFTLDRAAEVARQLATLGLHRAARPVDLIIAAAAESAGLTVLHYDRDFERIARATGQPTEWVAPPGTLD